MNLNVSTDWRCQRGYDQNQVMGLWFFLLCVFYSALQTGYVRGRSRANDERKVARPNRAVYRFFSLVVMVFGGFPRAWVRL